MGSELLLQGLLFVGTLAGLVKASDWFVGAAERIGVALGVPSFIIGVTVVAAGTSLPELISSLVAVSKGASEIVVGNVVGSNIANIGFILGLVGVMAKKFTIHFDIRRVDLPMLIGATLLMSLCILDGRFSTVEAVVMCLGMALFLAYVLRDSGSDEDTDGTREKAKWTDYGLVLLSAAAIWACANYNIASIIALSGLLGVGSEVIALTAVSLGTSLPELVVSIVAMRKGSHEIVVGNVLGSNIFNTFAVMGIPGLVGTLVIPEGVVAFSLPVMLAATAAFVLTVYDKEVNRWEGGILLLLYGYFIVETVSRSL
jgi:cation:H+ antiporter